MLLFFFGILTYFDFFTNIIPRKTPIQLHNGNTTYNDGQNIINLLKHKKFPFQYQKGIDFIEKDEFEKAGEMFEQVLDAGFKQDIVFRLATSSFLQARNYHKAGVINEQFAKKHNKVNFNSNDYNCSALLKSHSKEYLKSLNDYKKSIELDPKNSNALNNRGYTYNLIGEYEKAIIDFDKAIELEPTQAYAYNHRGLFKIKLGKKTEGLKDINKSMLLDENNSYAHMNLGIYYYDIGEFNKAL